MSPTFMLLMSAALCFIGIGVQANSVSKRELGNSALNLGADVVGGAVGSYADSFIVPENEDGFGCAYKKGCHKGYCWAGCQATAFNNEWCYTTRGYSQDYNYVRCSYDSECDRCWKCAGSCTV